MTLSLWFSLFMASAVISFTPGAGAVNTISNALTVGWRRAFWGIAGQQLALIVHIAIVAAGVGLIVARSPALFEGIRYAGAAYLVFLGLRMLLTRSRGNDSEDDSPLLVGAWPLLRRGFWVNLLNPKAIVFFLAFVPQFIRLDQPALPQYLLLALTVLVVDVAVMWFFFAAAARPLRRATSTPRGQRVLQSVFGALFILMAALLLLVH